MNPTITLNFDDFLGNAAREEKSEPNLDADMVFVNEAFSNAPMENLQPLVIRQPLPYGEGCICRRFSTFRLIGTNLAHVLLNR